MPQAPCPAEGPVSFRKGHGGINRSPQELVPQLMAAPAGLALADELGWVGTHLTQRGDREAQGWLPQHVGQVSPQPRRPSVVRLTRVSFMYSRILMIQQVTPLHPSWTVFPPLPAVTILSFALESRRGSSLSSHLRGRLLPTPTACPWPAIDHAVRSCRDSWCYRESFCVSVDPCSGRYVVMKPHLLSSC